MTSQSKDAFAALINPYLDKLYRLAYRLTSNVDDAQDLVQDVLLKLYGRRDELTSIREISPWLGRVLFNQFIDDKRRYGRQPIKAIDTSADVEDHVDVANGAEPESSTEQHQTNRRLIAALARLSEEHRIVVLLHDAEGYKLNEIQELTGTSLGTLKSRLHRARGRLREILEKDGTFSGASTCSSVDEVKSDAL